MVHKVMQGGDTPSLLYLTTELPWPPGGGHKLRCLQLLKAFSRHAEVHLAGFSEQPEDLVCNGIREAVPNVADVLVCKRAIRIRRQPLAMAAVLAKSVWTGQPYSIVKFSDAEFSCQIAERAESLRPTYIVSTLPMMQSVPVGATASRIILDSHNVEHRLWADFVTGSRPWTRKVIQREARLVEAYEAVACRLVDGIIAICDEDAELISAHTAVTPVVVPVSLPQGGADGSIAEPKHRFDVGMVGVWSWAPNEVGLRWFASEIAPQLIDHGLSICVAGPGMAGKTRRQLERQGVHLPGFVDDLDSFYRSVSVVAAPYPIGGGVRMKVIEAIGHGVPVVGTPVAFRGIRGAESDFSAACIGADELVSKILTLATNRGAACAHAARLRNSVLQHHAPELGEAAVSRLLVSLTAI